jgi:OFA family oxalate/formate antiporter-like MFS transporter
MPEKPGRAFILISCACAIFWPGAFIFGFPGVMRHLEGMWLWTALAAVIGFGFGTLFAVTAPLAGDCFGMAHFGAIFGLIFTAYGFLSGPPGPWLSGYILDLTQGNYTLVFSYLGLMYLASAGLILLVRPWRECRL